MVASFDNRRDVVAPTRIGDAAAAQPVSGLAHMDATRAVHGTGRGAYVRKEDEKEASRL